jgi:hypothetical protein
MMIIALIFSDLTLYLLQTIPSMWREAEKVAMNMLCRVIRKTQLDKVAGKLLITWKDLKHTLGDFCTEEQIEQLQLKLSHLQMEAK